MSSKGTVQCRQCKRVRGANEPIPTDEAVEHLRHRIVDPVLGPFTGYDVSCFRAVVAAMDRK